MYIYVYMYICIHIYQMPHLVATSESNRNKSVKAKCLQKA